MPRLKRFPDDATIGAALVEHTMRVSDNPKYRTRKGAEAVERSNLGYFAGYYGAETRERVERLFGCAHPVFGKISEKGEPTVEEALGARMDLAR